MRSLQRFMLIGVTLITFTHDALAQFTATATASATIVMPINMSKTTDLNFGNIAVRSAAPGTAVITPSGSRSATGSVTLPVIAGTTTAASFTVTGEAGYAYTITLPAADLTISNGANTMTVNAFTCTPSAAGVLTGGSQTLSVGATLHVAGGQTPGTYVSAAPFSITVNYN